MVDLERSEREPSVEEVVEILTLEGRGIGGSVEARLDKQRQVSLCITPGFCVRPCDVRRRVEDPESIF